MNASQPSKTGHIHIIGICGVATSALAVAFHKQGWSVTGSDKGFYPPVSTYLTESGIEYYAGWHPEKLAELGRPDVIVAGGGGTSLSNPEVIYAKENNVPFLSFAEALGKYLIRDKSIVAVGTWGKTTSSALLSYILIEAGLNPSYFTGGLSLSHDTGTITDSEWSVVEGDEYQAAIWDKKPKFAYYKPTHLLLTSVSWDHADLYPTEADYFVAFDRIVSDIKEKKGLLVGCIDNEGVRKVAQTASIDGLRDLYIPYGTSPLAQEKARYYYHSVTHTRDGISLMIDIRDADGAPIDSVKISSPMLGRFNAENIAGCFAMAHSIGIDPAAIVAAIADFKGIKRRLERRYESTDRGIAVFDCHAPTPEKAASVLESLREVYPSAHIVCVYEPNIGGRQKASAHIYDNSFTNTNDVIIPRLTKLKIDEAADEQPLEGPELGDTIARTHSSVTYIEDDNTLIAECVKRSRAARAADTEAVIAFLGSHGFRGMIESTVDELQK